MSMNKQYGWIIAQQLMRYDEQQINNSLQYFEEQDELNRYNYDMRRSHQMILANLRKKESDISEWGNPKEYKSQGKKKSKFPYLREISKQKQKQYTYFLDPLDEQTQKGFFKYEKLPPYRIQKPNQKKIYPKRVNLKLPMPYLMQQSLANPPIYQSEQSLPLIKKIALPVKLLRKEDRQRLKSGLEENNEFKLQDFSVFLGIGQSQGDFVAKRGKQGASNRRQIRNFNSYTERNVRNSFDNNKLKECITFIK